MLYDEKDAHFFFHFFVAIFLDNIVVLNTNAFQVFPTIWFTFRPSFSQVWFQTRKWDFAKQKLSTKKRLTFFPTFAMKAFTLIIWERSFWHIQNPFVSLKIQKFFNFKVENTFEWNIFSKYLFSNDSSTRFSFNPFYQEFTLQKKFFWFWTIAKCRFHSATSNYPYFSSLFH